MQLRDLGEFGFIRWRAARLQNRRGVVAGIGDDAAVLSSLQTPVVTCDALIENVHFRRDWTSPFSLGRKAMTVNASDLAAKGARPVAAFVTLGVSTLLASQEDALGWLDALYDGMEDVARRHEFTIAGGDTTRTEREIVLGITLIGEVDEATRKRGAPVLRSGAHPGDKVLATGTLGDSAAGCFLLQHPEIAVAPETREYLIARHLDPLARAGEMQAALEGDASTSSEHKPLVHAALDLSDGLAGDASHIASQSHLQIEIEIASLPISPACREAAHAARESGFDSSAENWALHGGEDYELLLCVAPENATAVARAVRQATGTLLTIIGVCRKKSPESSPVVLIAPDGERTAAGGGWTHF